MTQPNVKIMLWRGETNVLDIVDNTPNNGRYRWRIPGSIAPGTYKIRVRAIGATTVGISAEFEITDAKITVTQPNTNVTWKPGETHLIQWTHTSPMDDRVWIKLFPIHEGLSYLQHRSIPPRTTVRIRGRSPGMSPPEIIPVDPQDAR